MKDDIIDTIDCIRGPPTVATADVYCLIYTRNRHLNVQRTIEAQLARLRRKLLSKAASLKKKVWERDQLAHACNNR